MGLPKGGLVIAMLFYIILVYFHNTHQVLVRLPKGVGGLAILHHNILFHFIFITRTRCS
jgi:hypothetical protein